MNDECEIRIYDGGTLGWLGAVKLAESVQLERELYGAGKFEIVVHPDEYGVSELARRGNVIRINGDPRRSGIIRDFYIEGSRNGERYVIYGETGNGLFSQRVIVPPTQAQQPAALGWDRVSGSAETVLKHYVRRQVTEPYDTARAVTDTSVAPDLGRGKSFPWQARYTLLSDELTNIGIYGEMGFETYLDVQNKRWVFDVIAGTDRTKSQNAVSPVSFNLEYQNVDSYKYTEKYGNYKSTGYAGGQGGDEKRLVYALGAEHRGRERWEVFLDCGNAANIDELIYYGSQKMNEYQVAKTVEVNALPRVFIYGRDYFLGDKVSIFVSRLNLALDTRITAVKEIWERRSGYKTEVRFGEKVPNLFTILKKREEVH